MLFSSLTFLFGFLPVLFLIYFICRNNFAKNIILLLFSLIFYAWGEPKYIFLMLFTVLIVYIFGILIDRCDKTKKYIRKKVFFIICIVLLIFSLVFFKYSNFIFQNINNIFGANIKTLKIVLPIGISFYTFQILSYIIDLYNKKIKVQNNFFNLALYVSFFPQLIAGPIVRYETIEEEISNRKESLENIVSGAKRFIIGLSKKIIIANQMAIFADLIYNNYSVSYGTSIIWLATIAYTFQIYFDFSGYSDMAIGLGKIFGFNFLENFDYPYISTSITEFWRRWHISLSSWFRDYVYIPLGGNRVNKTKWIRNIIIVWLLTGLWHGAAWNFIIWGLFYGFLLLFEKLFFKKVLDKLPKFICWLYTIFIILIGWLIFRVNSLEQLIIYLKEMFIFNKTDWIFILSNELTTFNSLIFIIPAIIFSTPIIKKINIKFGGKVWYTTIYNIMLLVLLLVCITCLTSSSYNPFIYFRF
ncbi:MAG: MBOAT family protein [Bacilli bacterium]|nr:MBOAT family protein [Bacilli bacterium]